MSRQMNTISETAGASFETPIQRQPSRNATSRPQVRTVLYEPAHDDGHDPDLIHEDEVPDPDLDQDGFIPIDLDVDDN